LNTTEPHATLLRPGPLRLAGPVTHAPLLAALQLVAVALVAGYALLVLAAAWAGCQWLASLCGMASAWPGAVLFALLSVLAVLGRALPLALLALPGSMTAWHWPWWAAALLAVPQLGTWLPGWVAAGIARMRHG
jgi:hypothetical protein